MEPKNGGWEDDFPLKKRVIFRFHVNFEECILMYFEYDAFLHPKGRFLEILLNNLPMQSLRN